MATHRSELSLSRQHDMKSFVMKAHKLRDRNPSRGPLTGWYMEEKIDGLRARWLLHGPNGRGFYSATGRKFPTPPLILDYMQSRYRDLLLDGELTAGRGNFQRTSSIVRNGHSTEDDWLELTYQVFDLVQFGPTYEERRQQLEACRFTYFTSLLPTLGRVSGDHSIETLFNILVGGGAEGLIVRNPQGIYTPGYSHDLLKRKKCIALEVLVVGHLDGNGKHEDRLGALICEYLDRPGRFQVGTGFSDAQRERPPIVGDLIEIEFNEYTDDGLPRHPVFKQIRNHGE